MNLKESERIRKNQKESERIRKNQKESERIRMIQNTTEQIRTNQNTSVQILFVHLLSKIAYLENLLKFVKDKNWYRGET